MDMFWIESDLIDKVGTKNIYIWDNKWTYAIISAFCQKHIPISPRACLFVFYIPIIMPSVPVSHEYGRVAAELLQARMTLSVELQFTSLVNRSSFCIWCNVHTNDIEARFHMY